jgi:amino acid adenylation domain-containing protein
MEFILRDSDAKAILTHSQHLDELPETNLPVFCLDREQNTLASLTTESPQLKIDPRQLAYVMYTSGSTGEPKGVEIEHRSVVNFLSSMANNPGFTSEDSLLAVTTPAFDISVLEFFLPLVTGGHLIVAGRDDTRDGARLARLLEEYHVTTMQGTPATWQLLIEAGWKGSPSLRVLCGGESLPRELASQLLVRGKSLWNLYGPTETTIWSTIAEIKSSENLLVIGRPIDNTEVFIVNEHGQPAATGVSGELLIGGVGLARGYRNRTKLTRERFFRVSIDEFPEHRFYRTGDVVRLLGSGQIEFLGRKDSQVKLRGFRVELGEVENCLLRHGQIQKATVIAQEDESKGKTLVAYLVSKEPAPSNPQLRKFLREHLPEYMIPNAFVTLDSLPMTASGKVDRKLLPKPVRNDAVPRLSEGQEDLLSGQLMRIWEEILDVRPIGLDDNFFDVGGHSLLAARLFARLNQQLNINLPLATLYEAPTIQELSDLLNDRGWTPSWSSLVSIQRAGDYNPLFLVHGAGGNVLLYKDLASRLGPRQPVYGLQSKGLDGDGEYLERFEEMAEHYINELRKVQPSGPYQLGGYCLGGVIAFEMAQQLIKSGDSISLLALLETYNIRSSHATTNLALRFRHIQQNLSFHIGNLRALTAKNQLVFLREKAKVARRRARRFLAPVLFSGKKIRDFSSGMPHIPLTKINDDALARYEPKPFPGRIVLIRPRGLFRGYEDPEFGWGGLAEKGVEVVEVPVYPRGMLIEPYVGLLAERLKRYLDRK